MTVFYPLITSTSISKAKSLLPKIGEFFWSPMRNANVATGAGFCKKKTSSNDILANGSNGRLSLYVHVLCLIDKLLLKSPIIQ